MTEIMIVSLASFVAGFVDAVAGGGGLIQIPMLFITYPSVPAPLLLGTNKIPSFAGTGLAAQQYLKHISIDRKVVGLWMLAGAIASIGGSYLVTLVNTSSIKFIVFFSLIGVAIYSYINKDFGLITKNIFSNKKTYMIRGIVISIMVGFYDGFLGPGSGNLFILGFISILGFDFLKASAHAKLLNLSSNFGSILLFGYKGAILWNLVIPMTIANMLGSIIGTKMAFLKGNKFIRIIFIGAISLAIIRYGRDIFKTII